MTNSEILKLLRTERRLREINQVELAIAAGFNRDLLSKWENGIHSPKIVNLIAWAEALGFRVEIRKHDNI